MENVMVDVALSVAGAVLCLWAIGISISDADGGHQPPLAIPALIAGFVMFISGLALLVWKVIALF